MEVTDEEIIDICHKAPTYSFDITQEQNMALQNGEFLRFQVHIHRFTYPNGSELLVGRLFLFEKGYVDTQFHEQYPMKPFEMDSPTLMPPPSYMKFTYRSFGTEISIPFMVNQF